MSGLLYYMTQITAHSRLDKYLVIIIEQHWRNGLRHFSTKTILIKMPSKINKINTRLVRVRDEDWFSSIFILA